MSTPDLPSLSVAALLPYPRPVPKRPGDVRTWCDTDRAGERVSIARPAAGVRLMSVTGSHRHWQETHATFSIAVVRSDQPPVGVEWRTRQRALSTGCGGLMAIEPGDVHVTERLRARRGVADFDLVQFAPELLTRAAAQLDQPGQFHFRSPSPASARATSALERLVTAAARGDDALSLECATAEALLAVVGELGERQLDHGVRLDPERDHRLRRVKEYLVTQTDRRPTLGELEAVSGLCQWRLCAIFKRSYGVSLGQWWNAQRLGRAVRDLERGTSIPVIVSALGYTDEAYFNRVFKAHYGITPGAWRTMFRGNDRVRGRHPA
jgi:AraC-like DNA-binding protein